MNKLDFNPVDILPLKSSFVNAEDESIQTLCQFRDFLELQRCPDITGLSLPFNHGVIVIRGLSDSSFSIIYSSGDQNQLALYGPAGWVLQNLVITSSNLIKLGKVWSETLELVSSLQGAYFGIPGKKIRFRVKHRRIECIELECFMAIDVNKRFLISDPFCVNEKRIKVKILLATLKHAAEYLEESFCDQCSSQGVYDSNDCPHVQAVFLA